MDKVYQVFVSSTFSDLQEERKQVSDALAKAGFVPAGMELFPATDQKQLAFIKRVIDRCDYYVVIVGGRYGSLDGEKSFTEKEFEYWKNKCQSWHSCTKSLERLNPTKQREIPRKSRNLKLSAAV